MSQGKMLKLLFLVPIILLLNACSAENDAGNTLDPETITQSVSYTDEVPDFPMEIKNYKLLKSFDVESMRLFEDDGFSGFKELDQYSGMMSCQDYFWMIRWRSDNSEVLIRAGIGFDTAPGEEISWEKEPSSGGAGFLKGKSCYEPLIAFSETINGNGANLVDVNYEMKVWEYKPKI